MQIRNRLFSERRTAASDELLKRLKASLLHPDEALAQIAPGPTGPGAPASVTRASVECRAPSSLTVRSPPVAPRHRRPEMTPLTLSRAAVLLLLVAAGCQRRPPEDPSAAPVAWVNGQVLTRAEFERELARSFELADGTSAPTPDQLAALRHTVLQAGVDRLLFVQEGAKRGLEIPAAEVEQRLQRMRADWPSEIPALLAAPPDGGQLRAGSGPLVRGGSSTSSCAPGWRSPRREIRPAGPPPRAQQGPSGARVRSS